MQEYMDTLQLVPAGSGGVGYVCLPRPALPTAHVTHCVSACMTGTAASSVLLCIYLVWFWCSALHCTRASMMMSSSPANSEMFRLQGQVPSMVCSGGLSNRLAMSVGWCQSQAVPTLSACISNAQHSAVQARSRLLVKTQSIAIPLSCPYCKSVSYI
jgi:hypothetical protein